MKQTAKEYTHVISDVKHMIKRCQIFRKTQKSLWVSFESATYFQTNGINTFYLRDKSTEHQRKSMLITNLH